MATADTARSTAIADIQRQMAQIRSEMHQEVQGAVRTAQALTDWQAAIRTHPWVSLATATVVGYWLVPRRQAQPATIVAMGTPSPMMMPAASEPRPEPRKTPWRLVGTVLSLVAPIAVRAAQNYVLGQVENWLALNPLPTGTERPGHTTARESTEDSQFGVRSRLREYR